MIAPTLLKAILRLTINNFLNLCKNVNILIEFFILQKIQKKFDSKKVDEKCSNEYYQFSFHFVWLNIF